MTARASNSNASLPATAARAMDTRHQTGKRLRDRLNLVFPDHWSFMLGELAVYSFVVLLITGIFLAFFYTPSEHEIPYQGSYLPLRGVTAGEDYISVLHITFDVRAGLLMRQIHHWAALFFVAVIVLHLFRVFFTGAFRKPRDTNWMIGVVMLLVALAFGFTGYNLPDDLISEQGVRISYSIVESLPFVGGWLAIISWGGQYPGRNQFMERLFIGHVAILPLVFIGLLTVHLILVRRQGHTQFREAAGEGGSVVGRLAWPYHAIRGAGVFFTVFGVLAFLGGFAQIYPIWLYGPYDPAKVSTDSQPDWYVFWLEGGLRLMPGIETTIAGYTLPWDLLVPAIILPGFVFTFAFMYPVLERRFNHDWELHHFADRPRDHPVRTGIGAGFIALFAVLIWAAANDLMEYTFRVNMMIFTWALRALFFLAPPVAFAVTYHTCRRFQRNAEAAITAAAAGYPGSARLPAEREAPAAARSTDTRSGG